MSGPRSHARLRNPKCSSTSSSPTSTSTARTAAVERCADARFVARALDASNAAAITELARHERVDVVLNACDPRLNPSIFAAAFDAGCHYIDMAMTLSEPHPERPYEEPGVMLGAAQFAASERWAERGLLALVGHGRRARPLRRLRPLRRRPSLLRDRRGRRARRQRPRHRRLRLRADVLGLDHDRGVPQPAAGLGARPRLVHDRAVLGTGDVRVPRGHRPDRVRERRARRGAADPACGDVPPGHVQVRARRRVHRGAARAGEDRARVDHAGARCAASRCRRAISWPRCCPIPRRSAIACTVARARERG